MLVRLGEKPDPFAALLLDGFTGARGGIDIWQVIDLDSEVVTYAHPSEIIAALDDRGLEGPDRHPEHQPAKPDWEGVASGVVFAE
ncbi:MAG: hypothetical protein WBN89_11870 [Prochlorococcaceae cyanobacterium]